MKNNFTQALRELTGFDSPNDVPKEQGHTSDEQSDSAADRFTFTPNDTVKADREAVTTVQDFTESGSSDTFAATRVTSTMVITGDVRSGDDIYVNGQLIGDVKTSANLFSTNLILGNVNAGSASLSGARIKGDVTLSGDFVVGENSVVVGDVKCAGANISGKVKGNCTIDGSARLTSSALLVGDVTAEDIATEQGAKIVGMISTGAKNINVDEEFDFGGDL